MRLDFHTRREHGDVRREDRNAGFIGLSDSRADGFGVARREHDRIDPSHDEIGDLVALFGRIKLARREQHFHSMLRPFVFHGVAEVAEKRIRHGEQGNTNNGFLLRGHRIGKEVCAANQENCQCRNLYIHTTHN